MCVIYNEEGIEEIVRIRASLEFAFPLSIVFGVCHALFSTLGMSVYKDGGGTILPSPTIPPTSQGIASFSNLALPQLRS